MNYCGKCGRKIDPETGLCPKCDKKKIQSNGNENNSRKEIMRRYLSKQENGNIVQAQTNEEKNTDTNVIKTESKENHRFHPLMVVLSLVLCFAIVGSGIWLVFSFLLNKSIEEEDFNTYTGSEERIMKIEAGYLDSDGYIPQDKISSLLDETEKEIINQMNEGIIKAYNRDNENIYIEYKSGIKYLFVPHKKDVLGIGDDNNILTLEPNASDYGVSISLIRTWIDKQYNNLEYQGSYTVNANAKLIAEKYPDKYAYGEFAEPFSDYLDDRDDIYNCSSFSNDRVTVERMKKLDDYKVIIFEGHGNHNDSIHSMLFTGEKFIGWKDFSQYKDDIANGEIILSSFPSIGSVPYSVVRTYGVTSKFFERHINKMDNTIVFLGSCRSGKDRTLADTFLSKGAAAVLAFNETVSMEYEMIARSMFFYYLTNENISIEEAFNRTVNRIGKDSQSENACLVYFDKDYSASTFTLSGEKPLINSTNADASEANNGSVSGGVVSSNNNAALKDVSVTAYQTVDSEQKEIANTSTGEKGGFELNLPAGNYDLVFIKDEYKPHTLGIKIDKGVMTILKDDIVLEPDIRIDVNNCISDAVNESYSVDHYSATCRLPKFLIDTDEIAAVNSEILNKYNSYLQKNESAQQTNRYDFLYDIDYTYVIYDNILSLMIKNYYVPSNGYSEYSVYNIDISSASLLSRDEMMGRFGIDWGLVKSSIRNQKNSSYGMKIDEANISDDNLNNTQFYIGEDKKLYAIYRWKSEPSIGGEDGYRYDVFKIDG